MAAHGGLGTAHCPAPAPPGAKMREAGREISICQNELPVASSAALAIQLLANQTSPSQAAMCAERVLRVQQALDALDATDREILALRNCEQLSREEAAQVLGIAVGTAAQRYVRALKRLKTALAELPGGEEA